jgi:uncharacterized damage-inducible protein DinB
VLAWLKRHGKRNRDGMARYGLPSDNAFGVTMAAMKGLARRLGRNHDLAAALWDTGWYEARILTSFVDDILHQGSGRKHVLARDREAQSRAQRCHADGGSATGRITGCDRAMGGEGCHTRAHQCLSDPAAARSHMTMNAIIRSIRAEYLRYKALAEGAIGQLSESDLLVTVAGNGNSIAVICWHIAGNLRSRFTDFLTTDGEKPWRKREEEFEARTVSRAELLAHWERGWNALLDTLSTLTDDDLSRTVTIRGQSLQVAEALHRSLAHASYHVGQIVYVAKGLRGEAWRYLSIPPGQSDRYNAQPNLEKPDAHAASARRQG